MLYSTFRKQYSAMLYKDIHHSFMVFVSMSFYISFYDLFLYHIMHAVIYLLLQGSVVYHLLSDHITSYVMLPVMLYAPLCHIMS